MLSMLCLAVRVVLHWQAFRALTGADHGPAMQVNKVKYIGFVNMVRHVHAHSMLHLA